MAREGQDERQPCRSLPSLLPSIFICLIIWVAGGFLLFSLREEAAGILCPLGVWQTQAKGEQREERACWPSELVISNNS